MPDSVSNSDIDAILRRQISSVAAQEKCERSDPNEISAYLEGALSSKRVADFEQHLVNCGICRRAVIELRALGDEDESPISETAKADLKTDQTEANVPSLGVVERLRKLLFGSGGSGYMWRPAAALVMILLIVAAPAILFLRQTREANNSPQPVGKNDAYSQTADKPADGAVTFSASSNGVTAQDHAPSGVKTVDQAAPQQAQDERRREAPEQPAGVAGQTSAGGPPPGSPAPAPPPPPPPTVAASDANKDVSPPKTQEEKQLRDAELDKLQREASVSNSAYGGALTWNVTITMTPVETRSAFALSDGRRAADLPDRSGGGVGGGGRGGQTAQPPASAKSAPRGKSEVEDTTTRADDAKRKEATAKKPADSPVPYDKRVGQILKARFDKLMEDKVRSGTGVTVKIRIGPDGSVISLKDGKVLDGDFIKRSSNDIVNTAVMKAITEGKLPAFGETEKDYSQVNLIIKFEPTVN